MNTVSPGQIRKAMGEADAVPADGVHYDIPFEDYLGWDLPSQTIIKEGRQSMAHLKAAVAGERVKEVTDDMALGTALHTAFLEPANMLTRVALWEGGTRRGKDWEAFRATHKGKTILTKPYFSKLIGMVSALRKHPVVKQWAARMEATEVSAVGTMEGVRLKARCDALTSDPLVDLKKVTSTDPRVITWTVLDFGYHIQAAVYRKLFGRDRFMLICQEGTPPYDVVPYELSPAFLRHGADDAAGLLQAYAYALKTGVWPGRSDDIVTLEPPEWLVGADDVENITFGGEALLKED